MNEQCSHIRSLMADAITASLAPEEVRQIQEHVDVCPACRSYQNALEADDGLLSQFADAAQPVVDKIAAEVISTLHARAVRPRPLVFWMKPAVAAVIAVGAVVLAVHLLWPLATPSVSLAQTLDAMRGAAWIHVVETSLSAEGGVRESWECFEPRIIARKDPDGRIAYANYVDNVRYSYNPNSNKVMVSFTTDDYMIARPRTSFEQLAQHVRSAERGGARVTRERADVNGVQVERIFVDYGDNPRCKSMLLVRDVGRNLLTRTETVTVVVRGGRLFTRKETYDYPKQGPDDIYALGVPRDAAVFDLRPEGPALALVDRVQQRFEQGLGDSLAVVLESGVESDGALYPVEIAILQQQGKRKQSERYRAYNFRNSAGAPATLYPLVKDDWPDVTVRHILEIVDANALTRRLSFDGTRTVTHRRDRRGELVRSEHGTDRFMMLEWESLASLVWPNFHLKIQTGSSQVKREIRLLPDDPNRPGLVGLQFVHFAETEDYWFDPAKDDMRVEYLKRRQNEGVVTRLVVTQSAQAPSGQWYPQVIRIESRGAHTIDVPGTVSRRERRVLVDLNPMSEDGALASSVAADTPEPTSAQVEPADDRQRLAETGLGGLVKDERGRPVSDATVLLYYSHSRWGLGNKVTQTTQTGPDGRFALAEPIQFKRNEPHAYARDFYVLLALHPDHAFAWRNVAQGREDESYELTLTAPTTRVITVTDHNDNPLAGTRVWLYNAGDRTSTNPLFRDYLSLDTDPGFIGSTTDAAGNATITNLPATACSFHAILKGYATGLAFPNQNRIRLSPGANVSGWVLTDAGDPVEGATVSFATEWMNNYFLAETDSQGYFEFTDLPAQGWDMSPWGESVGASGAYTIRVKHADYATSDETIELLPGQVVDDMVIQVAAETTLIRCLVVEERTDNPVPGARISGRADRLRINGYSDVNGIFEVRVLPGPVELSFYSPPDGVYVAERSNEHRLSFVAEGPQMTVTLKGPPIGGRLVTVAGTVYGPEGQPVANAVVYGTAGQFYTATAGGYIRTCRSEHRWTVRAERSPCGT